MRKVVSPLVIALLVGGSIAYVIVTARPFHTEHPSVPPAVAAAIDARLRAEPAVGERDGDAMELGAVYAQPILSERYPGGGRALLVANPTLGNAFVLEGRFVAAYRGADARLGLPVGDRIDGVQRFEHGELTARAGEIVVTTR